MIATKIPGKKPYLSDCIECKKEVSKLTTGNKETTKSIIRIKTVFIVDFSLKNRIIPSIGITKYEKTLTPLLTYL